MSPVSRESRKAFSIHSCVSERGKVRQGPGYAYGDACLYFRRRKCRLSRSQVSAMKTRMEGERLSHPKSMLSTAPDQARSVPEASCWSQKPKGLLEIRGAFLGRLRHEARTLPIEEPGRCTYGLEESRKPFFNDLVSSLSDKPGAWRGRSGHVAAVPCLH